MGTGRRTERWLAVAAALVLLAVLWPSALTRTAAAWNPPRCGCPGGTTVDVGEGTTTTTTTTPSGATTTTTTTNPDDVCVRQFGFRAACARLDDDAGTYPEATACVFHPGADVLFWHLDPGDTPIWVCAWTNQDQGAIGGPGACATVEWVAGYPCVNGQRRCFVNAGSSGFCTTSD
jgi:hypothetical protein